MIIEFRCDCGKLLEAEPEWAGKKARCPQCKRILEIPSATGGNVATDTDDSTSDDVDDITVECVCGKYLSAERDWIGKLAKCPGCGEVLRIPNPSDLAQNEDYIASQPEQAPTEQPQQQVSSDEYIDDAAAAATAESGLPYTDSANTTDILDNSGQDEGIEEINVEYDNAEEDGIEGASIEYDGAKEVDTEEISTIKEMLKAASHSSLAIANLAGNGLRRVGRSIHFKIDRSAHFQAKPAAKKVRYAAGLLGIILLAGTAYVSWWAVGPKGDNGLQAHADASNSFEMGDSSEAAASGEHVDNFESEMAARMSNTGDIGEKKPDAAEKDAIEDDLLAARSLALLREAIDAADESLAKSAEVPQAKTVSVAGTDPIELIEIKSVDTLQTDSLTTPAVATIASVTEPLDTASPIATSIEKQDTKATNDHRQYDLGDESMRLDTLQDRYANVPLRIFDGHFRRGIYLADSESEIPLFLGPYRPGVSISAAKRSTANKLLTKLASNADDLNSWLAVCRSFSKGLIVEGQDASSMLHVAVFTREGLKLTGNVKSAAEFKGGPISTLEELDKEFGQADESELWPQAPCEHLAINDVVYWWGYVGVAVTEDGQISHIFLRSQQLTSQPEQSDSGNGKVKDK